MKHFISSVINFVGRPTQFVNALLLAFFFATAVPTYSQTQSTTQNATEDDPRRSRRLSQRSDLANENYEHLAAAPRQLQEVLVKDPGLLVELKRLAIKQATDNGQIVEDSSLTDQAIFDRLEQDIKFRSLATRLVQRYGYLLPTFNPDSELGKQREFILKERARRQTQLEAEEDAEIDSEIKRQARGVETADTCDPPRPGCEAAPRKAPRRANGSNALPEIPDQGNSIPEFPLNPSSPILRAQGGASTPGMGGGLDGVGASQQLSSLRNGQGQALTTPGQEPGSDDRASRMSQMFAASQGYPAGAGGDLGLSLPLDIGGTGPISPLDTSRIPQDYVQRTRENNRPRQTEMKTSPLDLSPVSMVHRPNPYADIPSLYDMYVQASAKQGPVDRFGLQVFRNQAGGSEDFPIDLPAGPDYMVGPGDGLAIDLWGGVSQRISRTVDRQGRISLPESGPVLVSGTLLLK